MRRRATRLLLIDDSPADLFLLRALLQQVSSEDYDVLDCSTTEEALRCLNEEQIDGVLLDCILADQDGLDLLNQIRASGFDGAIITVSGCGLESVAVEALKRGADDHLVKGSISAADIQRTLHNAFEKRELLRELDDRNRELESFAHVAAHDLRSPLCSLMLLVDLVKGLQDQQNDQQCIDLLDRMRVSTERMARLLDSLLAHAESGRRLQSLVPVSINDVVEVCIANLQSGIFDANAEIQVGQLPDIQGDEVALVQLFQNLISNAIKFCDADRPSVSIQSEAAGDDWRISVSDNGIGIDPEMCSKIFTPFTRLQSKNDYEGSGIGLATCKRIVEQHHGQIHVSSSPGSGTTFTMIFPAICAEASDSHRRRGLRFDTRQNGRPRLSTVIPYNVAPSLKHS
ncbi:MAG: response regulator [Fuerstiella sp.]